MPQATTSQGWREVVSWVRTFFSLRREVVCIPVDSNVNLHKAKPVTVLAKDKICLTTITETKRLVQGLEVE